MTNSLDTVAPSYLLGILAVTEREIVKFMRQRERLLSAIVRPSLWLFIFASGSQNLLGVSIIEPYQTYTPLPRIYPSRALRYHHIVSMHAICTFLSL